jgi:23S rRNA pseudouridine2605 synthase
MNDGKGRPNLGNLDFVTNMHPVGRLDYDTSGLILFSSDGTLTQKLLHPRSGIQKEYVALVAGTANEAELRVTLAEGVETAMGKFPADLVHAKPVPAQDVRPMTEEIIKNLPPEYDLDRLEEKGYLYFKNATELSEVRLVVEEGKHRMVRKILANSGLPVIGLKRERIGVIHLGGLPPGSHRALDEHELQWAESLLRRKIDDSS